MHGDSANAKEATDPDLQDYWGLDLYCDDLFNMATNGVRVEDVLPRRERPATLSPSKYVSLKTWGLEMVYAPCVHNGVIECTFSVRDLKCGRNMSIEIMRAVLISTSEDFASNAHHEDDPLTQAELNAEVKRLNKERKDGSREKERKKRMLQSVEGVLETTYAKKRGEVGVTLREAASTVNLTKKRVHNQPKKCFCPECGKGYVYTRGLIDHLQKCPAAKKKRDPGFYV